MATAPTGARNSNAIGIRTGATAKRSIMVTNGPADSSRTLNPASRIDADQPKGRRPSDAVPPLSLTLSPSGRGDYRWNVARHRRGVYRRLSHDGKVAWGRSAVVSTATESLVSLRSGSEKELGSGSAQPQPSRNLRQSPPPVLTDAIQVPQFRPKAGGLGMPS